MAIFYFIFVSIDWMLIAIGNALFDDDRAYKCLFHVYLIVNNAEGAWYLICHSIFVFLFSLLIWFIFYRIPDKYGLLKKKEAQQLLIKSFYQKSGNHMSQINPNAREFLDIKTEDYVVY